MFGKNAAKAKLDRKIQSRELDVSIWSNSMDTM